MIDLTKKYRTRDGHEVDELRNLDDGTNYPLIGFVFKSDGGARSPAAWNARGAFYADTPVHPLDLIEVPQPETPPDWRLAFEELKSQWHQIHTGLLSRVRNIERSASTVSRYVVETEKRLQAAIDRSEERAEEYYVRLGALCQRIASLEQGRTHNPPERRLTAVTACVVPRPLLGYSETWRSGDFVPEPGVLVAAHVRYHKGTEYFSVLAHNGTHWMRQGGKKLIDGNPWRESADVLRWRYVGEMS